MKKTTSIGGKYTWDIAISLLARDMEFAESLYEVFNKYELNIFLYPHNQKDIANKSGIDVFKKTFRSDARVVVLLYRQEYGSTKYTKIEHTAIQERYLEEGADFCVLVPLDGNKPIWYPSFQIYTNNQMEPKDIAELIIHKVMEQGGELKEKSFEEYVVELNEAKRKKFEIGQKISDLNNTQFVWAELEKMQKILNQKAIYLRETLQVTNVGHSGFSPDNFNNYITCNGYYLSLISNPDTKYVQRPLQPNGITIKLEIFQNAGVLTNSRGVNKSIQKIEYKPTVSEAGEWGWAKFTIIKEGDSLFPFEDENGFCYDLHGFYKSEVIMEGICREFISIVANNIKI